MCRNNAAFLPRVEPLLSYPFGERVLVVALPAGYTVNLFFRR